MQISNPGLRYRIERKEVLSDFKNKVSTRLNESIDLEPKQVKICRVRLGIHKGQDLFKDKYKDNIQVCLVPDIKYCIDNSVIEGRTLSFANGGMAAVALLNPSEARVELPKEAKMAKAQLVRTQHVKVLRRTRKAGNLVSVHQG